MPKKKVKHLGIFKLFLANLKFQLEKVKQLSNL